MNQHRNTMIIISFALVLVVVVIGLKYVNSSIWNGKSNDFAKSIVLTLKGNAAESAALTWHTERTEQRGVVQFAPGNQETALQSSKMQTVSATMTMIEMGEGVVRSVHKADLIGLTSGTEYVYRVGDGTPEGWSQSYVFQTAQNNTNNFSWINIADTQGVTKQDFTHFNQALNQAFTLFPDAKLIVHNGDLTEEPTASQGWDEFFLAGGPWITRVPFLPVTGNHDEIDGNAEVFVSHFNLPSNGAAKSTSGTNYTVDYGNVHFVFLNTESHIKAQTEWLEKDLASNTKEWTVVAIHRPAYGGNSYKKIGDWITVFDKYGVDLVVQGHNHEYSRSYPLHNGKIVKQGKGTIYVTPNTTGPKFNEKKEDQFYHAVHFQNDKGMFAGVTINNKTLTYQAFDIEGNKLDEFVIQH